MKFEGKVIKYLGKEAICKECGELLDIDEIINFNNDAFKHEYRKMNNLITNEEINNVLEKYKIGKRPLSLVLGLGEQTITRYLDGYIPTSKISNVLKKILNNPSEYYNYLLSNNDKITNAAYKKTKTATEKLLGIDQKQEDIKLLNTAKYIIQKTEPNNLQLQKLLYYVHMFFAGFYGRTPFVSKLSAWNHGPVFGHIYYLYKSFGSDSIICEDETDLILDEEVKYVTDNVIKYFGGYSGKTLEAFTHMESLWENSILEGKNIITKNEIKHFATDLIRKFEMKKVEDISRYSEYMYKNYQKTINW